MNKKSMTILMMGQVFLNGLGSNESYKKEEPYQKECKTIGCNNKFSHRGKWCKECYEKRNTE